jgi:EAL domain-containing protein (putative c-di-GMP-specific phosphodiesterase class I)/GGDEF domain-containing protein
MTLGRQLASAISAIFMIALIGVQVIHLRSAHTHLQRQLESLAQDAATSLGLSLGALMRGADAALAETIINPAFDRGHYERIDYLSATGELLVTKVLPPEQGKYPAWFVSIFPLESPTAESLVSSGWRQLGKVRVTVHPRYAYEQLWVTARDTLLYLLLIYVGAMIALRIFLRGLLRPLAAVEAAAQAISSRNFVTLNLRPSTRELARVVEAMNSLSRKVNEAIEGESMRAEKLHAVAYGDPVTGLLNGRGFAARFESTYEGGEHEPFSGVLALVEIADLGAINRQFGPERCDDLLRSLYQQMGEVAKATGGFAGRWTGALIILALPQLSSGAARERLTVLRTQAIEALKEFGLDRAERIYCAGVEARRGHATLRALARGAEEAMLQAREAADGIVVLEATSSAAASAAGAESDPFVVVRDALAERRLQLFGQVAYRMSDHRPLHTEILSRLRDAAGNEMTAAQFMPIVAAHGLSDEFDRGVIERVVAQVKAQPRQDESVSINLSMRSAERPEFLEWLGTLLQRERAVAGRLVFEMAEHGVAKNPDAAAALARTVNRAGAGFAIDNFGVHRDSLVLVQRLRPAYIKLAAAHTPRMVADAGTRFFAESLVRAARQLDIPAIAQSVEDDITFQSLGALGFAGYQGHLIGRPAPWPKDKV